MSDSNRENDLILKPGEYCFLLDKTKGTVSCLTGNIKLSMSASDTLVTFSETEKKFVEVSSKDAIKRFITIPENWYSLIYNPTKTGEFPKIGTSNVTPDLIIGKKIVQRGPASFALFPGQMAKVIKGHSLRSNQYLMVRVYDSESLGNNKYINGQIIVIKGTETQFFIPKTGMEVIPIADGSYVRDAVTLERLEYTVLRNEQGEKRYVRGPAVVFPEADEQFVMNPETNTPVFMAIELSDISGIYLKVICDYDEEIEVVDDYEEVDETVEVDGEVDEESYVCEEGVRTELVHHKAGEELFITGKDQRIYFPRSEHAIISYEGKVLHHAIAIPDGEGRYILDRLTGKVRMITGPRMYLPDPRYEVICKRKLTKKECELWYPKNRDVLKYNGYDEDNSCTLDALSLNDNFTVNNNARLESVNPYIVQSSVADNYISLNNGFIGVKNAVIESKSGFSRGNTYSKPRTITIDNKFDGVVTVDVWTGYAVNIVSKSGNKRVVIGPQTAMLEYDETLEVINNDTVYLRIENDMIYDSMIAQTKDFVNIKINLFYNLNFDQTFKNKWFSIDGYIDYLKNTQRSIIKKAIKKINIEELYNNSIDIISEAVLRNDAKTNKPFTFQNGMYISDVEIINVDITDKNVKDMIDKHQSNIIEKTLDLSAATKEIVTFTELKKIEKEKMDLEYQNKMHEIELGSKINQEDQKKKDEYRKLIEASQKSEKEAKKELRTIEAAIEKISLQEAKEKASQEISIRKEADKLEADKEKNHTDAIKKLIDSISPDLVSAIETASKSEMLRDVAQSLAPYALASGGESVADVTNKLLRGTGLENLIDKIVNKKE